MRRRSDRSDHPVVIDFIVRGTPKSQGARFRGEWQDEVRRGVPAQLPLLAPPYRLRIDFFYDATTDLDVDNIIKPIQDALEGIVYDNDEAVVDVCSRKINFRQLPPNDIAPPTLSAELTEPRSNFVYIRIAEARNLLEFQ